MRGGIFNKIVAVFPSIIMHISVSGVVSRPLQNTFASPSALRMFWF